jgi:S-DNA-T family DNA segregation ATPase FtsK/SpoIIIE
MLKPRQTAPPPQPKELGEYHLPQWDCLEDAEYGYAESQESFVREKAAILEQALKEFEIEAHVVEIDTGPVITMYELALAPGIKVSAISALQNDIQRALKAETGPHRRADPGQEHRRHRSPQRAERKSPPQRADADRPRGDDEDADPALSRQGRQRRAAHRGPGRHAPLPHRRHHRLGQIVCINTIIMSIMYMQRPDRVKLILFDPKVVENGPVQGHSAPDVPHHQRDRPRHLCARVGLPENGRALRVPGRSGVRTSRDTTRFTTEELIERFDPADARGRSEDPEEAPYMVIIIDELAT